jgi:antitoxin ParD1/3/4
MKNTSVTLGDHFDHFIAEALANGRYRSASEIIREGLRLLEDRETKLAALKAALLEGEQSGFAEYSLESLIEELDARHSS